MTIGITIFSSFGYDHITMFQWVDMHVKQQSHCIASNKLRKFTKINIISTHNNKLTRALLFSCNVMYSSIFWITQNERIYHLMSRIRKNEIDMYINLCVCKITYLYIIMTNSPVIDKRKCRITLSFISSFVSWVFYPITVKWIVRNATNVYLLQKRNPADIVSLA